MKKIEVVGNDKITGRPIRLNKKVLEVQDGKDYASVIFMGDVHYGSPECDIDRALSMLRFCEENEVYIFLMGDLLENANRYSVGAGVYEQKVVPQIQIDFWIDELRKLAEKKLILGIHFGNHESRLYQACGVNPTKIIANALNISYLGESCWSVFQVGAEKYKVYSLHGSSGSRFVYTKLKAIVDISHSFSADLLAMGHVHDCADASQLVQYYDAKDKTIKEHKKFLLITGHYLRYDKSYGAAKGYPIPKMGSPKVKFFSNKHDIHISW